jgi:uncharacterized protein involved in exopolysaccharide biosynthesis
VTSNDQVATFDEDEINLVAIWRVVWRRKFSILLIALVCGAAAAVYALTATEIFRAEVVVTEVSARRGIESTAGRLSGLATLVGVNLGTRSGEAQEARAILVSRRLAEEFIRRHDLIPTLMEGSKEAPEMWFAVQRFRNNVASIRYGSAEGTTVLAIDWPDPVVAAQWANDFIALANELIRVRAVEESERNIAYLNEQIPRTNLVEVQRVMYGLIQDETKTLMLANGRLEYAFTVVDPAVPPKLRVRPNRTLLVMVGIVIGLFIGVGGAFAREMFVRSRRGPRQTAERRV